MKRICLLVLVGLPGAGKTSFSRWLLSTTQTDFKIIQLSYDDFFDLDSLLQPGATGPSASVFKTQREQILESLETILEAITKNKEIPNNMNSKIKTSVNKTHGDSYLILLDDNHYYRSMRYKIYQLCKQKTLAFGQVYFVCDLKTCLLRNATRPTGRLPESVIEQMAVRFEPPSSSFYWEALTLKIVNDGCNFQRSSVLNFVLKAFENIPKNETCGPSAKNQINISLLHTLDILLRRRICDILSGENCQRDKRDKAAKLNTQRKDILKNVKESDLFEERLSEFVDLLN